MNHKLSIEVELRDLQGHLCLRGETGGETHHLLELFESRVTERVSGVLCMDHFVLPAVKVLFAKGRWVVKIDCCCLQSLDVIEQRLYEEFTKP